MWQDWLNFLLGLWLVIAGFIPALNTGAAKMWDYLIVGVLVLIFALWTAKQRWPEWLNVILAIWLIIAAFINWPPSTVMVNSIIVGALIAIFGLWAALMKPSS